MRAREMLESGGASPRQRCRCNRDRYVVADLCGYEPRAFDVAAVTFTLSFLPCDSREGVLRKLRNACPGGFLFLADKLRYYRELPASVIASKHQAMKSRAGLTLSEIEEKSRSLVGVQFPWTLDEYLAALTHAGWCDPQLLHVQTGFFACVAFAEVEQS